MKTYWIAYYDGIGYAYYYHDELKAKAEFIRLYFTGKTCGLRLWETYDGTIWDLQPNELENLNPTSDLPF